MAFEELTDDRNKMAYRLGMSIYEKLIAEYPEKTIPELNLKMNALCVALTCLIHQNVAKDDRGVMIQVMHKILTKNC